MKNINAYIDELKGLDRHNIGSWPDWAYGFVIVILCVVVAIGSYWYVVKPSRETLNQSKHKETQLRHTFARKHEKVAHLAQYQAQLKTLKTELAGLLSELPSKTEVPDLLRDVSNTRAANGLTEQLFRPRSSDKHKFYVTLPNELDVTGHFHDLARFVSDVAALSRIVTISDVNIKPVKGKTKTLKMSATLKTYRYLSEGDS